jgi:hypothetical protein
MPRTAEWLLGFASAATLLEGFFIGADRQGLLSVHGPFELETLNMSGGCIVTVHNPVAEVIVLGVFLTGVYRGIRGVLSLIRSRQ